MKGKMFFFCSFPAIIDNKDLILTAGNDNTSSCENNNNIDIDLLLLNQNKIDINAAVKSKLWIING